MRVNSLGCAVAEELEIVASGVPVAGEPRVRGTVRAEVDDERKLEATLSQW